MTEVTKVEASVSSLSMANATAIGSVQLAATVYAAKKFTGPARYVYGALAVAQGLGLVAISVAQGVMLSVARQKADEEKARAVRRAASRLN